MLKFDKILHRTVWCEHMDNKDFFSQLSKREKAAIAGGIVLLALLVCFTLIQTTFTLKTYRLLNQEQNVTEKSSDDNGIVWENDESNSNENGDTESVGESDSSTDIKNQTSKYSSVSSASSKTTTAKTTAPTTTKKPEQMEYVLNVSSYKIHSPDCSSAKKMKDENKKVVILNDKQYQEYLDDGYTPCGICKAGR